MGWSFPYAMWSSRVFRTFNCSLKTIIRAPTRLVLSRSASLGRRSSPRKWKTLNELLAKRGQVIKMEFDISLCAIAILVRFLVVDITIWCNQKLKRYIVFYFVFIRWDLYLLNLNFRYIITSNGSLMDLNVLWADDSMRFAIFYSENYLKFSIGYTKNKDMHNEFMESKICL